MYALEVVLTACRDVVGFGVADLLQHCCSVRALHLCSCDGLTDEGVCAFAAQGGRVVSIEIGGSWTSSLSDTSLEAITAGCPRLHLVQLQCMDGITNQGLQHLVDHCPGLRTMSLVSCDQITAEAVDHARADGISCDPRFHKRTQTHGLKKCVDLMCEDCFPKSVHLGCH